MTAIRSIATIKTTVGYAVRIRRGDGPDLFFGPVTSSGHRYTEAEARTLEQRIREQVRKIGEIAVSGAHPLPTGITVEHEQTRQT